MSQNNILALLQVEALSQFLALQIVKPVFCVVLLEVFSYYLIFLRKSEILTANEVIFLLGNNKKSSGKFS